MCLRSLCFEFEGLWLYYVSFITRIVLCPVQLGCWVSPTSALTSWFMCHITLLVPGLCTMYSDNTTTSISFYWNNAQLLANVELTSLMSYTFHSQSTSIVLVLMIEYDCHKFHLKRLCLPEWGCAHYVHNFGAYLQSARYLNSYLWTLRLKI